MNEITGAARCVERMTQHHQAKNEATPTSNLLYIFRQLRVSSASVALEQDSFPYSTSRRSNKPATRRRPTLSDTLRLVDHSGGGQRGTETPSSAALLPLCFPCSVSSHRAFVGPLLAVDAGHQPPCRRLYHLNSSSLLLLRAWFGWVKI